MDALYQRTEALVGPSAMQKLKESRVFLAGLGGVGGYVCEALARAGVGTLGLCDFDTVDPTNLNRQIIALENTVGRKKTEVFAERIRLINPDCRLLLYPARIVTEETAALYAAEDGTDKVFIEDIRVSDWSYIADAIDDVRAKVALISAAHGAGVPVISSMGTGNKLDPLRYQLADISKSHTDPLAKAVRVKLREKGITKGVKVLFSDEEPLKKGAKPVPSISYMPAAAGLIIASAIIRDLISAKA